MSRNAFEAVCELAARERWCWKLFCTTCANMHFRYAFRELTLGRSPDDEGWVTRMGAQQIDERVGEWAGDRWGRARWRTLIDVAAGARLEEIRRAAPHPDWLGYLGVVLYFAQDVERVERKLTEAWFPQLEAMQSEASRSRGAARHDVVLSWQDLAGLELVLAPISGPRARAT